MRDVAESIVVGALVADGRVLLVHRRAERRHFPDCWDLPGGHVEAGEEPGRALARELEEELGVRSLVTAGPALHLERRPELPDGLPLDAWVITAWEGEPVNRAADEHDDVRWFGAAELPGNELAHAELGPFLLGLLA